MICLCFYLFHEIQFFFVVDVFHEVLRYCFCPFSWDSFVLSDVFLELLLYCFKHFYAPEIKDRGAYCFVLYVILSFCPPLLNFYLANNFWTVSARAFIFHMCIPCEKTFLCVPLFFPLWPWPWSLTHFLKTLTLLIT